MKSLIAIFAASMLATPAVAGDQYKDKDKSHSKDMTTKFEKLDQNADARLSKTEASEDKELTAEFASIDQNSDGYVSKAEFSARLDSSEESPSWSEESR